MISPHEPGRLIVGSGEPDSICTVCQKKIGHGDDECPTKIVRYSLTMREPDGRENRFPRTSEYKG